jgi:uncharacterized membrane protein SpoIIM required for sporulation
MVALAEASRETTRFEALLDRCERSGVGALGFDELVELGRLHRRHLTMLARLRARGLDAAGILHLNALSLRAHTVLYVPALERWSWVRFARDTVPAAFARAWPAIVLAWALLGAGILMGGALVARDPLAVHTLIPQSMIGTPDRLDALLRSRTARAEFFARNATAPARNLAFGSLLFTHNTRVGLLAFATGILAGVPTVLLQLYNGIVVGAFAAIFFRDGWPLDFLAWILPHGIPELTAITLCAAAGLVLGAAGGAPSRRGREAALREEVGPALALVGAAVPLLVVAALTESFVRESTLGTGTRFAVAGAYAIALVAGLAWIRRVARRAATDTRWLAALRPPLAASRGTH